MSRLEVEGITKTLDAGSRQGSAVLRGIDLVVRPGECLGLKGATGSGKSTLLRIIAGLMPADTGEVRLDGEKYSAPHIVIPPSKRRIGMVFQNLGLWPHMNVLGHLNYVLATERLSRTDHAQRLDEIINAFVLNGLGERYPSELSGGERHLLALARAFCGNIQLLLLDEPFTGLDGALKKRVLDTLKAQRTRRNLTTLLVTHDDEEMRQLCNRVEHISEGRILERITKVHNSEG
jgi:ABC-type sulfate/molybdate transport systems ATPase subunit